MGFMTAFSSATTKTPGIERPSALSPTLEATPSFSSSSDLSFHSAHSSSSSLSSTSSGSLFWMASSRSSSRSWYQIMPAITRGPISKRQFAVFLCVAITIFVLFTPSPHRWAHHGETRRLDMAALRPYQSKVLRSNTPDPELWLSMNSDDNSEMPNGGWVSTLMPRQSSSRPRAALISLVRNSELPGLVQSMSQLEYHWNHKYQYPWIFFNEEPFTAEFKVCRVLYAIGRVLANAS